MRISDLHNVYPASHYTSLPKAAPAMTIKLGGGTSGTTSPSTAATATPTTLLGSNMTSTLLQTQELDDDSTTNTNVSAIDKQFSDFLADADNADAPEDILAEITSGGMKGYLKWQVEQMKKKVTSEVMADMGVTKDGIAAMPADQRAIVEKTIMDTVQQKLKMAIEEQMKKQQHAQFTSIATPDPAEDLASLSL